MTESLSSCFVYIPSNDTWIQTGSTNDPKGGSAYGKSPLYTELNINALLHALVGSSLVHGFTIAGGYNFESDALDTVETTFDGISFAAQTPLQDGTEQSCLSFIDEDRFIVAGGIINGFATSSVFLHNLLDGTSTRYNVMHSQNIYLR